MTGKSKSIDAQYIILIHSLYNTEHNHDYNDIIITIYSVYWVNDPSVDPQKYPKLLPQHLPRVIDPANPANNVWESGVNGYRQGEKLSNYEMGDGNTAPLKRKISSIDLSKPIE